MTNNIFTNTETQFNAGVDIALNLSKLIKEAEYYASAGEYPMWFIKLEAAERRMWTKFRGNVNAKKELEDLKTDGMPHFKTYMLRFDRGRKIPKQLGDDVKLFLSEYEKLLIYWRDTFGYGMPSKDDSRFALG
mgnify:CR=1 FL=1|tara:strand:+ start:139 stop:537 length:399 start_codon:yes stop_codon:yes gene_type:complete